MTDVRQLHFADINAAINRTLISHTFDHVAALLTNPFYYDMPLFVESLVYQVNLRVPQYNDQLAKLLLLR